MGCAFVIFWGTLVEASKKHEGTAWSAICRDQEWRVASMNKLVSAFCE